MVLLSKRKDRNFNTKSKGQSAIEYLMTYGWMLLVVSIAGGAVFSVVGDQGVESISGFTGDDVQVDDFGVSDEGLDLVLRNAESDTIDVNEVRVTDGETQATGEGTTIDVGRTETVLVSNVESGDSSQELDVTIDYDMKSLTNLEASGTITGDLQVSGVGFTVNDSNPEPGQEVEFEDTSNLGDLEGGFEERRWDFDGDGEVDETTNESDELIATYTYDEANSYTAELEVETDENNTATQTISVEKSDEETADVTTSGGELDTLQTESDNEQVINVTGEGTSDDEACVGENCEFVNGEGDEAVTTEGARMDGSLNATNIEGNVTVTSNAESLDTGTGGDDLANDTVLTGDLEVPTLITSDIDGTE